MTDSDTFGARSTLEVGGESYEIFRLDALQEKYDVARLPYALKVLLENLLRNGEDEGAEAVAKWSAKDEPSQEIAYRPARVLMQDFTGVPAIVDLAAMRDAMEDLGGDATKINPLVPVELVIDHSIQVDVFAERLAFQRNAEFEFERNNERYAFLRWGQKAFDNFSVVPPNTGICHQVNLEYLARVVESRDGQAFPDTLVGTDSHTTMVNGLGVLGWGVGGIEAEAAMLGQPVSMLVPQVVGFRLSGELPEGATATDLVLTVTEMLRERGVVEQVRRVLWPRAAEPAARRPRDDREHVARDGRHLRDLPGRRGDAPLPRVLGPPAGAHRAGGGLLPRAGPVPRRGLRGGRSTPTRWSSTSATWCPRSPGRSARRTAWRSPTRPRTSAPSSRSTRATRRRPATTRPSTSRSPRATRPRTTAAASRRRSATATRSRAPRWPSARRASGTGPS